MEILTYSEAIKARKTLNLSQAKVANIIGVNRSYVSQFETGQRILEDDLITKMRAFFMEEGYMFDEQPSQQAQQPLSTSHRFRDGLLISGYLSEEEIEALLVEKYELESKLKVLGAADLDECWLGSRRASEKSLTASMELMARIYYINQTLQGRNRLLGEDELRPVRKDCKTTKEVLDCLLGEISGGMQAVSI